MDLTLTPTHLERLADVLWTWTAAFCRGSSRLSSSS